MGVRKFYRAVKKFAAMSAVVLAMITCAPPPHAHAQYIGNVGLQTTQQTLATTLNCTGAAQVFAVSNLGQTQHYLSIASVTGAQTFQGEIDGIDKQGNVFRISDVLELAGISTTRQGSVSASGYFPKVQVQVTCTPITATFTASYSGSQVTFNNSAGSYLTAQIDKLNFFTAPANVNQQDMVQTPFGSSAGTLYFQYVGSSVANGVLSVLCSTNGLATVTTPFTTTLANSTITQVFQIPDTACPFATVAYTSPGGGTTVSAEYVFAVPGLQEHASTDPCQSGSIVKTSSPIVAAAAGTTQIVALSAVNSIYVCGYQMSQVATAGTVQWEYGTGVNCGTGTTIITGAMGVTASSPFSYGSGGATVTKVPTGNALCLVTTGAGGTVGGIVTYIQSP
jgi:hypothetical protein